MSITLTNVNRVVDGEMYLADINLHFDTGSRNVLLGRTLAGKTTLLRIMAGLDRPSSGQILVKGDDVTGVSVRKRSVAMVYQQFINYPSLSVYKNIASPLKMSGLNAREIEAKVREVSRILHLDPLLQRLPAELSGGQQQRTAIARALVKDAHLLLLDEPLVNLDYKLREELRIELQEIFQERDAIVVYTTTEPAEALMMGGDTVVMDEGRVLQSGPTPDVYRHPGSLRAAEVFSDPPINYLSGEVETRQAGIGDGINLSLEDHMADLKPGRYHFGIRAHHLSLKRRTDRDLEIPARVELAEINGSESFVHVNHAGSRLVVQETGVYSRRIDDEIRIYADPARFFVYDESGALVAAPPD